LAIADYALHFLANRLNLQKSLQLSVDLLSWAIFALPFILSALLFYAGFRYKKQSVPFYLYVTLWFLGVVVFWLGLVLLAT
jgi:hypothetical protein